MKKVFRRTLALLLTLSMLMTMGIYVFAENEDITPVEEELLTEALAEDTENALYENEIEEDSFSLMADPIELHFKDLSTNGEDLYNTLRNNGFTDGGKTPLCYAIKGPGYTNRTTLSGKNTKFTLTDGGEYEVLTTTSIMSSTWRSQGSFKVILDKLVPEFRFKESPTFPYYPGKTITEAEVFAAVVASTTPTLTASDVSVEYVQYKGGTTGTKYWKKVSDRGSDPGWLYTDFHYFGERTEEVRIVYGGNDEYIGLTSDSVTVIIYDPRIETKIVALESPIELEYNSSYDDEDYINELKSYFKVYDINDNEITDAEIGCELETTIVNPGDYNVKLTYGGKTGIYFGTELNTSFTIKAPAMSYTIDTQADGDGTIEAPTTGDFDGLTSKGFTATATPATGCYTEKIEVFVNEEQEPVAASGKEVNTITVGDGLFNASDAVHVKATFKPATFEINGDVVYIPDNTPVTSNDLKPLIFGLAYNGSEPKTLAWNNVTMEYKKEKNNDPWEGDFAWKPEWYETGHAFYMNDGDGQDVRFTYEYNGASIQKTVNVKTYDHRPDTEIKCDTDDTIILSEQATYDESAYINEIKSHISVWVKDGEQITGAAVKVTGLAEKYNEVQTVTVSYAGDSNYKPATDISVNVNMVVVTKYTTSITNTGSGTGTTNAPAKVIIEDYMVPGFTVTAKPSTGCYFESIEVKNGDTTVFEKTKEELETIIGELSFEIPEGCFADGDVATIIVDYEKADITLHDGPIAYYTERTNEALRIAVCEAVIESATPYDVSWDSIEIDRVEYDYGKQGDGDPNWTDDLAYSPAIEGALTGYKFRLDVGTSQLVRIVYKYNGETIKKTATVYGADLRADTEIRVDSPEEVIEINECDDMKAELDKLISVAVVDGDVITDAEFTHDLDLDNFNNEQTVTITYEGTKTEYKPVTREIKVKLVSDKDYVIELSVVDDSNVKLSFSNRTDSALGGDVAIAAYGEDSSMTCVAVSCAKFFENGTLTELVLPLSLENSTSVEFFLWESLESATPILHKVLTVED